MDLARFDRSPGCLVNGLVNGFGPVWWEFQGKFTIMTGMKLLIFYKAQLTP